MPAMIAILTKMLEEVYIDQGVGASQLVANSSARRSKLLANRFTCCHASAQSAP